MHKIKPSHQTLNLNDSSGESACQRRHFKLLEVPEITGDCTASLICINDFF